MIKPPPIILSIGAFLALSLVAAAETEVRVRGMQGKTERQVLELVGPRLAMVRAKPAVPSRADDAAFLVRQVLENDGYDRVVVDWRIASPNEIILTVKEGTRLSLGDVEIKGVDDSDEARRLEKLFSAPAVKNRPIGTGDPPFRENDVEEGVAMMLQDLRARGYWGAEVTRTNQSLDSSTGEVAVDLTVVRGPLFKIGPHQVTSVDGRGVVRVATTVQPFVGLDATTGNVNSMRAAVLEAFISRGYPDAEIRMASVLEGARFIPNFTIDLGTRKRLRNLSVAGLDKTKPRRIERYFNSLRGEWYDEAALNKGLKKMLATGAFSSARIETTEVAPKRLDATLLFEEADAREITVAAGAGSYEGLILRATYGDRNLYGRLLGLTAGAEISNRGVLGEVRLTDPFFLGQDLTGSARLYALSYDRNGYSSIESGLELSMLYAFTDHYRAQLLLGGSRVSLTSEGLPNLDLGETDYTHLRMSLTSTIDYRDSPVLPSSGWFLENPLQIGTAIGDESSSYFRAELLGGYYRNLGKKLDLAIGGRAGVLIPTGEGRALPIDLRLFNGGANTVRSFPERELGPQANGYATGGEAAYSVNVELIREVAGPFKMVGFLDVGSLSRSFDELDSADPEIAVGLGARLALPIGPIRFEYGYNLTRDPGEPTGAFHFAIGAVF